MSQKAILGSYLRIADPLWAQKILYFYMLCRIPRRTKGKKNSLNLGGKPRHFWENPFLEISQNFVFNIR